jgi:cellobiose dehydrogenase (acceptor)
MRQVQANSSLGTIAPSADRKWYDAAEYNILSSFLKTQNFTNNDPIQNPNKKTKMFTHPPWNIKNGQRAGPLVTYLPLVEEKSNFALQMYTTVLRVIRSGSKITGVEVQDSNTGVRSVINICSSGRVILAAGSMTTPRLLINSGIGPTEQIQIVQGGTTNITLPSKKNWINLPVGSEIKDVGLPMKLPNGEANTNGESTAPYHQRRVQHHGRTPSVPIFGTASH